MWARARRASGSGSIRSCRMPNFAQIVIVTKDLEARERVKARLEKAIADGALPEARTRVDRFVFGPPVGFPVQFRVVGPDPLKVREIAEQVRKVMADQPEDHRPASRLERAGEVDPPRGRPGSRPRARPHPAGRLADAADAAHRPDRDAVSRGHREHRRGGARRPVRAARARPAADSDHRHAQRRSRCRCRRSRVSTTNTRSRSCGGATATSC